jgi:hypothetical protein
MRPPPFVLIVLTVLWPTDAFAEPTVAGRIIDYAAPSSDYEVRRRQADGTERRVRVARYLELMLDDRIVVKSEQGLVDVDLGTGRPIHVRRQDSPFPVPARMGPPPSVLDNVALYLRRLGERLTLRENLTSTAVSAISRGSGPLAAPLLAGRQRVQAGARTWRLAWTGGVPPYTWRMLGPDDALVVEAAGLAGPALGPVRLDLGPGRHVVEIEDGAEDPGRRARLRREILVVREAPPRLAALEEELSVPSARALAGIAWLAGQDDGAWRLEAYLRSWADAAGNDTAVMRLLRDALADDPNPP